MSLRTRYPGGDGILVQPSRGVMSPNPPRGRNAARVSGLCRVREGFFSFLAPHPDRRGAVRLKLQVEIAVLGNSPCEIAVLDLETAISHGE